MQVHSRKRGRRLTPAMLVIPASAAAAVVALTVASTTVLADQGHGSDKLKRINHIVVIYEENHSFDNLYGGWEGVNGLRNADAAHTLQVNQNGTRYSCLFQNDANLTSPVPLAKTCTDSTLATTFPSAFKNQPFEIDGYIPPTAVTCPPPLEAYDFHNGLRNPSIDPETGKTVAGATDGGCTRDIVHKYYQEIYQLNGGKQNRYVTGSDAVGLVMGHYDTCALPIYRYLHSHNHPRYAIADNFFQAAFGGSFLNHQWLIAAATPRFPQAAVDLHAVLDENGFPAANYPLYTPTKSGVNDGALTQACGKSAVAGFACGDFAVNTMQPAFLPSGKHGARLPAQMAMTIGDRMNKKGVDWAWYSGGWSNADGDVDAPGWTNGHGPDCIDPDVDPKTTSYPRCPNSLFQFHHQPFNYFAAFSTETKQGQDNRKAHLKDEQEFIRLANASRKSCELKQVSFVKPNGKENEHPGYASEPKSNSHLVDLLQAIEGSYCAKDTMVAVIYDEFGGQWDHVPPPGQGNHNGPHDIWGPGTRIPALIIYPGLPGKFVVDHTEHDTTSILATIEHRYGLEPLSTRDAAVSDLSSVFDARQVDSKEACHGGLYR